MGLTRDELAQAKRVTDTWWLFLITGVLLFLYGFLVLSFTYRTVWAVAILAGVGFIGSGVAEVIGARLAPGWRWLHYLLGIVTIIVGVLCLVWPGTTFLVMVRLVGWVLLAKGVIDIILSFQLKEDGVDHWWIFLALGLLEVVVAVWAVRYPGRSLVLLVLWVGFTLLSHGITAVVTAFALRSARKDIKVATA